MRQSSAPFPLQADEKYQELYRSWRDVVEAQILIQQQVKQKADELDTYIRDWERKHQVEMFPSPARLEGDATGHSELGDPTEG